MVQSGEVQLFLLRKPSLQTVSLVCTLVAALVYLNTLDCGFCFDDLLAIESNQDLRSSTPWGNLIWDDFWGTPMHIEGSHKSYRPLCVATFRLNYLLHELQPMGYHLVNVLLHSAVCYLYVQLCGVVFSAVWPALIAGLLFAVHPIHTEAVAGVVGRAETLSALFFLLSLFCYRRAAHLNLNKGVKWLVVSLLFCFCSVLSKEQGITAVAVCFTYDVFIAQKLDFQTVWQAAQNLFTTQQKKKLPPTATWLRPLLVRGVLLFAFTVGILVMRVKIMKAELPIFTVHDNPAVTLSSPYRQLHWSYLSFVNFWLLLNPSFLCADWTMGTISLITSIIDPRNLATLATLVSVTWLGVYGITGQQTTRKATVLSLSLIVFPYIPASNLFFPVGFVVAERVLYVPSMGFCMLVALGTWRLLQNNKFSGTLVAATKLGLVILLATHVAKTLVRNRDWQSDTTLFLSAVQVNPNNGKVYNNLGSEYEKVENHSYAEALFRKATLVQPDDIGAFINLGRVLKAQERLEEAEKAYRVAVELMPKGKSFRVAPSHINVYYNLANLVKLDPARAQEAYNFYQTAISMKPDFVEAHMNKGDLLLKLNRTQEAITSFEKAIQYNPDYTDAHFNLGTAYVQFGMKEEAVKCYRRALLLDRHHVYSMMSLAMLLQESNDVDKLLESKDLFETILSIEPLNARAASNLALVYLDLQNVEKSEEMFLRTLQIDPTYRSTLYNLGVLYNRQKRYTEAMELLSKLATLYPDHLNGVQLLGDCYLRLQQQKKAEEMYKLVLRQNPNHTTALHNLGVVKAEQKNFNDAIELFSQTLRLDPTHETAKKHLEQAKLQLRGAANRNSSNRNPRHTGR